MKYPTLWQSPSCVSTNYKGHKFRLPVDYFAYILRASFLQKVYMCLQFGFVIFWQKEIGAKAVSKMLVKLTLGGKT